MMRPPISTPYDPDDCIDSYGWLWTHFHKGEPSEWHLVSTHLPDGIDAHPQIVFHDKSGDEPLDVDAADTWKGAPYIPLNAPACGPRAGALVVVHLPRGATVSTSHEDGGADAEALTKAALRPFEARKP
jgi:hypothetical protein